MIADGVAANACTVYQARPRPDSPVREQGKPSGLPLPRAPQFGGVRARWPQWAPRPGVGKVIRQVFGPMTVEDKLVFEGRVQDLLEGDAVRKAYLG